VPIPFNRSAMTKAAVGNNLNVVPPFV
jgi:hypothetical protein